MSRFSTYDCIVHLETLSSYRLKGPVKKSEVNVLRNGSKNHMILMRLNIIFFIRASMAQNPIFFSCLILFGLTLKMFEKSPGNLLEPKGSFCLYFKLAFI